MAITEDFCFCCTLETGAMITGCLGAAASIFFLVFGCVSLAMTSSNKQPNFSTIFTLICIVSFAFLNLLSCILLFIGITMKRAVLVLPWLITGMIGIFAITATMFMSSADFLLMIGLITVGIFFWVHTLAYYQHLKSEGNSSANIENSIELIVPDFTE